MTRPRAIDRAAVDRAVLAAAAIVLACQPLFAQTYGVSRAAIAGGGGTSSAGSFTVTGTIGQPESGAPMAGGTYEVTGGFWSFAGTDPCAFSIAPTARTIAGAGGSDTVTVTLAATTSICPWTATSQASWIAITSGASGTGSGSVGYAVALNNTGQSRIGTLTITGQTFTVTQSALPTVALSAARLNFGVVQTGGGGVRFQTPAQPLTLTQSGAGLVSWTASADQPWVTVSPAAGVGPGTIDVAVTNANVVLPPSGSLAATITIATTGAANSPAAAITLNVIPDGTETAPSGVFDTPQDGLSDVNGSIAVTGWAIDDVGVTRVRLVRNGVPGEGAAEVYIGDAVFVNCARPDIAGVFPAQPYADRAGWGYLLLTNFLPNQGNGPVTLAAYADDIDGHSTLLGRRTIVCNNAGATVPFGAIDTPAQGGTVSGGGFLNFGWALTPQPKSIPADGSTIQVFVDSLPVGTLDSFDNPRADIQALFPGYANTDGAVGLKVLDTTTLANGVHTIAWLVVDNTGAAAGIGSRYFTVSNSGLVADPRPARLVNAVSAAVGPAASVSDAAISARPVAVGRGVDGDATLVYPDPDGVRRLRVTQLQRVTIDLMAADDEPAAFEGFDLIGDELRALPIGSSFDRARGVFSWAPGLAFGGTRTLVFVRTSADRTEQIRIRISIDP